jgi:hypothetical protein
MRTSLTWTDLVVLCHPFVDILLQFAVGSAIPDQVLGIREKEFLGHDRRGVIHFEVTQNPTQVWLIARNDPGLSVGNRAPLSAE